MPLPNPIGEPLEELESFVSGITPNSPSILPGISTNKPLSYQTDEPLVRSEKPNLIETTSQPKDELSRVEADAFIINKASDTKSIPIATTSATNSTLRDATSEVDPLIGKLDSDLGDALTNPNRIALNNSTDDLSKSATNAPTINSSISTSELNKTTAPIATSDRASENPTQLSPIVISDKVPENPTQLSPTVSPKLETENNSTLPVVTASTAKEKAESKTPLSATAETSSKPEDNKTPLSSATTLKSELSANQTSPTTVLTPDKSEFNKTLPVTVSTSAQSESNKTSSTTASTSDRSEFNKTLPATVLTSNITEPKKTSPTITSTSDITEPKKTSPTITSTPDNSESNKTSPATTLTSTNSSANKTSPATAETGDNSEPNKISPATISTTNNLESNKTLPATASTSDRVESNKTSPAVVLNTEKIEANKTSPATVLNTDKSSANQPLPVTVSTAENVETNKTSPATVLNTDKSSANKPSPRITSTTDKLETNKTLPTTASTTDKSEPSKTLPDPTSTTDKIEPNKVSPTVTSTTTSTTDKSEPNKTSPTTASTTDKSEPNKNLATTASTTDKSEPNKNLATTASTTDKSEPNNTSPTETSTATNLEPNKTSTPATSINFDSNAFLVDKKGIVGIEFTSDGGWYTGQLAIVSLTGMDKFIPGSEAFIKEAAHRALSNSTKGYIAISDDLEGAYYTDTNSSENVNSGQYLGAKTFAMTPGDKFFFMLVPNGTVQQVYDNPAIGGDKKTLFSIATDNPSDGFSIGQIADITGEGKLFVMEDMGLRQGSDLDYDDITFRVTGATSKIIPLSQLVDPKSAAIHSQLIQKLKGESDKSEPKSPAESSATNSADKSQGKTSLITSDTDKQKPLPAATLTDSDTQKPQLTAETVANPDSQKPQLAVIVTDSDSQKPQPTAETVANPDSQKPQLAVIVTDSDSQKPQLTAETVPNPDGKELPITTATKVTDSDSQKPQLTTVANSNGKELPPTEILTVSQPQNQESTKTGTSTVGKSPTQESPTTVTLILDKLDSKEQSPTVTLTVDKLDNQESTKTGTSTVGKSPTQESPKIEQTTPNSKIPSASVNEFNSEIEPQVSTESIVSQPADAELIKTDKTATNRIPQSPVEAEDVVNDAASPSTAETTLIPTPIAFQSSTNPPTFQSITTTANLPIPGTFLVDNQGKVKFDYVFDGGSFQGEIGIFSLAGMSTFTPGTPEFIAEASRRVLSNSTDGHIVISDSKEGAKFTGAMPFDGDWGSGEYQGIKTFSMLPGDTFAVMLVPNATIQSSLQSSYSGNLFPENRPLFSISTANPNDTAHLLQIADITGSGNTFALEDMSPPNSDRDYNDLIFKISGATGNAPLLDTVINPDREWRNTPLGQQLLAEANPPNSDNNPPVVSPTSTRTYTELETTISLDNLATDAEGDPLTISVLNPVNGTVIFNPLTNKASFKPAIGFSGIASFDFLASDAFGSSTPARVTVNVSDVPLLNLDFVKRNPILNAGENTELIVIGDFADQKGVVLPDSYLTYTSFNPQVAPIDPTGKVTGLVNGTSILSASRNNLQAVTAVRVGKLPAPTNDAEFNGALAEINGLNVYPKAVTMTAGMGRSLLVGIENIIKSPALKFGSTGTRYFPGNSNLLQVNSDGVITAIKEGVTNVTVIHGAAEQVVPVRVSLPAVAGTILGVNGGAVTGSDGSIVMVPPGALAENTAISLTSLTSNDLSLQLPDGLQFAGGFNLDLGDNSLKIPAQLAIPAPAGLSPGTEILFLRKGSLPDANNIQNPTWLIQESGYVDASGTIRTNSPPLPGVLDSGEHVMVVWPALGLVGAPTLQGLLNIATLDATTKTAGALSLSTNFGLQSTFLAANAGLIGIAATTGASFAATILLLAYLAKYLQSGLKVIAIPQVGLPVVTPAGVELDPEGIPSVTATLNIPTLFPADPFAPPVLQSAEFKLENGDPTVVLTGSNFLNNSNDLGGKFEDLTVSFRVGDKTYPGILIPDKNTDLGENSYRIAVKIPITVPVGESSIVVSRKQKKRFGPGIGDYETVELESEENIRLAPTCVELALVTERTGDKINVINLKDALSTVETQNSDKLAVAINIPVGNPNISDRPESIAATNNATRAYVTLRDTGRVSVVDLMALREIDTTPETATVDAIGLPNGARPQAIAIDPKDNYAYIADQNRPNIYVLDINPNSATYHTVVETINVTSPLGLSQLAISSDGRRLFATGSDNNEQTPNRRIYAVNIDPRDKPSAQGSNERKWHQQIGVIPTTSETEGIAATSDPKKMVFTNGFASVRTISNGEEIKLQDDGKGFGVLKIESDDPLNFSAEVRYAPLSLGVATDYFDVNEAVAVTVTQDGKYAFVAGRNSRANVNTREGGNIGIIANPLGPNPQLVAATRPIPGSLTNNVALSSDGKYLIGSYPTLGLGGSSYVFDVEEMIKAIENPGNYKLDARDRGVDTWGFQASNQRNATTADLARVPIDDINPLVSIAADYEITGGNWINNFTFSVPEGTNRAPIGIGGNPKGLAIASAKNWLELKGPIGDSKNDSNPLTPTFKWDLKGENEPCGLPGFKPDTDVEKVNLYVSVFPQGKGLLPGDRWDGLNSTADKDYNPNRVLTAEWENGTWTWDGKTKAGSSEEFTLSSDRMLTAGQEYHWAVEATTNGGKRKVVTNKFKTLLPTPISGGNTFSSVTVLTRGLEPGNPENSQLIDGQINGVAKHIFDTGGTVMKYQSATGKWQSVIPRGNSWISNTSLQPPVYGKPLVLLANWMDGMNGMDGIEPKQLYNSGFAEAAADTLFASMVQLDLNKGGGVGSPGQLYDSTGKLIRTQGAVFNSPLHFIGFGQGAVVNSEIVQRLGTFLPDAGGTSRANRDLQMTTIDPYDYDNNSFSGPYLNILDPEIKVWNNVTYADNYYQKNGIGNTINGRELSGTNWKSDWNVSLGNRAGFTTDNGAGASHREALAWYAGTANLTGSKLPSENGDTIYRRLGDLEQNNIADVTKTWYTPEHTNASSTHGDTKAPWEGIGTGWFHSVLGGGSQLRPYFDGGKKTKTELGNFENYLKNNRVSVLEDNTYSARMRGDYAVPTLFNGNFDAVAAQLDSQPIPGWSLYNGDNKSVLQSSLVNRNSITTLSNPVVGANSGQPNYALKLNSGESITHNSFLVPDWGVLRLDIHVPESSLNKGGRLKVYLEEVGSPENVKIGEISLEESEPTTEKATRTSLREREPDGSRKTYEVNIPSNYGYDKDTIGYGSSGFETFHIDVPPSLRGKVAKLTFELQGAEPVYIDNAFFKSEVLKWGNPTEARNDLQFENNFLIEKPQYTLSYNRSKNTVNWVGWKLDKTWLGDIKRPPFLGFAQDPELVKTSWYSVKDSDYDALYLKDKDGQVVDNRKGVRYADGYVDFETNEKGNYIPILGIDRGHMAPAADRNRTAKDLYATFLTTNLLPQESSNNQGIWETIENQVRAVIRNSPDSSGLETYMFAGGYGYYDNPSQRPYTGISQNSNLDPLIQFPVGLWKVVMTKDKNTELPQYAHYGIYLGNDARSRYQKQSIQDLENLLNGDLPDISPQYQFLSNLPESPGKERIKNTIFERLP